MNAMMVAVSRLYSVGVMLPKSAKADVTEIKWNEVGLGRLSDRSIARSLGIHHTVVTKKRNDLGIDPILRRVKIDWPTVGLGGASDSDIAVTLGVRKGVVTRARLALGVAPFETKKSAKGIAWDQVPLGTKPDADIAKEYGVKTPVVRGARVRRGIRHYGLPSLDLNWDEIPLGEHADEALAMLHGTTQSTISRHRTRKGILPSKDKYVTSEGEGGNFPETLIDHYWHHHGIGHQFQVRIGKYIADWVLEDGTVVEYAGFSSSPRWGEAYKIRLGKKIEFFSSLGKKTKVIWPFELPEYYLGTLPQKKPRT